MKRSSMVAMRSDGWLQKGGVYENNKVNFYNISDDCNKYEC